MAWRALSFSSIALYMALRRKLQQTNNGNIEATISTLRHAGFKAPSTLAKGLRELQAVGLIDKTRQGGVAWGRRMCSLYRFTDEVVFEHPKLNISRMPATNDWRRFTTLAEAENAIADAHAAVVRGDENKSGVQKLYRANTDSVLNARFSNTDSVQAEHSLEQKLFQSKKSKPPANPRRSSVSCEAI
ncbi:hypothetical protein [Hydrogenophaga sp.]|uniref:hypothetical protein n=1 Tax=Hydrogenophaga sp. TaxID=1904254 RepID=UPI0026393C40|nr:hypothetical protein [Hydrogenophaga sp.]